MEGDECLTKFHGMLLSLSRKGLLNNPRDETGEGKRDEIKELSTFTASLSSFSKCKIAYYMALNSELKVSDILRNDELVGLFVNITPPISLQALVKWIHILNLYNEYCKIIENSPFFLGEDLVWAVLENPNSMNNSNFHFMLWCSVFKKICKIEIKSSLESRQLLTHYFLAISEEVENSLDLNDATHENVCALQEFLRTVLCLINYYKNPDPDDEMYKLSVKVENTDDAEFLNEKSINFFLETLYNILNKLNFEEWVNSLSYLEEWKTVRNLCDKLLNEIEILKSPSDVLNILSKLAVKESDGAIELLILDAKQGQKYIWTRNLINSSITQCDECPLYKMNDEDLDLLLHKVFKLLEASNEGIKELFLAAFALSHNQYKWLEVVFDKYQPNLLTTSNTSKDLIESFNKISTSESIPLKTVTLLCIQSPVETIKKLCQLVISSRATNLMVFQKLKPACKVLLPTGVTLLDHVVMCILSEELTSAEEDSFRRFVVELKKENLVDYAFFKNLIKTLKEFLEGNNIGKAFLCLTVIDSILFEMETVNKIAFLVFISRVLGYFSWDLTTFSTVKSNGRDVIYSIVSQLMAQLDCHAESEILMVAREEIAKCWEVNQACFCDLWFKFGKTWFGTRKFDSFVLAVIHSSCSRSHLRRVLSTFRSTNEVRASIVLALTKILPVLTLDSWCNALNRLVDIWAETISSGDSGSRYEIFEMFLSAWYLLTLQLNKDNRIRSCYKHCVAGFGRLFSVARFERESLVRVYKKILFIVKSIQDEKMRKSCYVILLPVLKGRLASLSVEEMKASSDKIEKILSELLEI